MVIYYRINYLSFFKFSVFNYLYKFRLNRLYIILKRLFILREEINIKRVGINYKDIL